MVRARRGDARSLRFGRTHFKRTDALDKHIRRTAALVCGAPSLNSLDGELQATDRCCYEESWQQAGAARGRRAPPPPSPTFAFANPSS